LDTPIATSAGLAGDQTAIPRAGAVRTSVAAGSAILKPSAPWMMGADTDLTFV
jgi:hypothetical protein